MAETHAGANGLVHWEMVKSVTDYVAAVRAVVERGDDSHRAAVTASELPGLLEIVQALVDRHRPDDHGRCRACRTPLGWVRSIVPWVAVGVPSPCGPVMAVWERLAPNRPDRRRPLRDLARLVGRR